MNNIVPNYHSSPQKLISSIIETIQASLSFVPNLLNPQPPLSRDNSINDTKGNDTVTSDSTPRQPPPPQQYTWSDVKIMNISIIVSTPESTDQIWHADGGHVNVEQHLPCHCCNIFIPLTHITNENGPTEFRPHSQYYTRQLTRLMLLAKARNQLQPIHAPLVSSLGDIIVFDYRILHRGRGNHMSPTITTNLYPQHHVTNTSTTAGNDDEPSPAFRNTPTNIHAIHSSDKNTNNNRVILVVTVSLPWFHDVLNFPKARSIYDLLDDST